MLPGIRKTSPWPRKARLLSQSIGARARLPEFYIGYGVPDTIDGRFDLLTLHVFLVMEALRGEGADGEALSSELVTVTFTSFESALRDLGVGDIGISRRIKAMANAFYGRLEAYRAARRSKTEFAAALLRNLYRADPAKVEASGWMAEYALAVLRHLEQAPSRATLMEGAADFGPAPERRRQ